MKNTHPVASVLRNPPSAFSGFWIPGRIVALSLAAMLTCSCAQFDRVVQSGKRQTERIKASIAGAGRGSTHWRADAVKGPPKIVVELGAQRAYFYKGKKLVGESSISTGRKGFETPPGRYRVIEKDVDHVSNLYGDYVDENGEVFQRNVDTRKDPQPDGTTFRGAPMAYFLRFRGGYGMHAGYVPRHRASHGCIRMPRTMAKRFFDAAPHGTPVIVED